MKLRNDVARDYELKLRRKIRIYKDIFVKRLNIVLIAIFLWFLYLSRGTIKIVFRESLLGYSFLLREAGSFLRKSGSFSKDGFEIKIVGLKKLDETKVLGIVQDVILREQNYDIVGIKKALDSNPTIRSVLVAKNLTNMSINIQIQEREFAGVFRLDSGDSFGIDSEGAVLTLGEWANFLGPAISVKNLENYEALVPVFSYMKYRGISDLVAEMALISRRRWNVGFKNGLLVKLPSANWHRAIDMLLYIDKRLGVLSDYNKIGYVDLRVEGKVFLQ